MKGNIKPDTIPDTPAGISIYSVTREAPHHHTGFLEILYCLHGPVTVTTRSQEVLLHEGELVSLDPFDIHYASADTENLIVSFYFDLTDPVFGRDDLDMLYFMCEPLAIPESKQEELKELKRLLLTMLYFHCFPHPKLPAGPTATRFAVKIVDMMLEHFHFFDFIARYMEYSPDAKTLYENILIYIQKNYAEKITLGKMSDTLHFNYKYLSRFFMTTSYRGFPRVVMDVRSYMSSILLLETNDNVSDIAYKVGFTSPNYYYRVFRSWTNTTPHRYRKEMRRLQAQAEENRYYDPKEKKEELEHFILFRFAELQVPELIDMSFIPFKGLPDAWPPDA